MSDRCPVCNGRLYNGGACVNANCGQPEVTTRDYGREFRPNEAELFNAVRVELRPDCLAVYCVEGGEVETALDGVTTGLSGPQSDDVNMGDPPPTVDAPKTALGLALSYLVNTAGEYKPTRIAVGSFVIQRGAPAPKPVNDAKKPCVAHREGGAMVWPQTRDHDDVTAGTSRGNYPWWYWRLTILANIIERLRVIGRAALVVHVAAPLLPVREYTEPEVVPAKTQAYAAADISSGRAVIRAGYTGITIETPFVTAQSAVFSRATPPCPHRIEVLGGQFSIYLSQPATENIELDWWVNP